MRRPAATILGTLLCDSRFHVSREVLRSGCPQGMVQSRHTICIACLLSCLLLSRWVCAGVRLRGSPYDGPPTPAYAPNEPMIETVLLSEGSPTDRDLKAWSTGSLLIGEPPKLPGTLRTPCFALRPLWWPEQLGRNAFIKQLQMLRRQHLFIHVLVLMRSMLLAAI